MKPQDVLFLLIFALLLFLRKPKLTAFVGISCLLLSMPLFATWVFFTAERLTWYAAAFFFLALIVITIRLRNN